MKFASNPAQAWRLVPWAWSAAWLLTGVGSTISDIYSSPSRSLVPYFALSALGWGAAGIITSRAAGGMPGAVVRLAAWGIAALAAILAGFTWLHTWNMGFFGPIAATGVAGAIGGVAGSMRPGVLRYVSGALLGLAFLLFAFVGFCASYFLILVVTLISQQGGDISVLNALVWPLPGALCSLGAGLAACWLLGLRAAVPTQRLQQPGPW